MSRIKQPQIDLFTQNATYLERFFSSTVVNILF